MNFFNTSSIEFDTAVKECQSMHPHSTCFSAFNARHMVLSTGILGGILYYEQINS